MMMNYANEHPFRNYENSWKSVGYPKESDWGEAFVGFVASAPFAVCVSVYRTWLIVRDLIVNTPKDLLTSQFGEKTDEKGNVIEGKKLNRLIFNVTSALLLDPVYLLSSLIQAVALVTATIFGLLPTKVGYYPKLICSTVIQIIEWPNAVLSANLAEKLGLDEKRYYN